MTQPCRVCGSSETVVLVRESGPHYGSVNCAGCNLFLAWAPWPEAPPGPPPRELVALCGDRLEPAPLVGTEAQVRWAESIRGRLLDEARRAGGTGRILIIKSISDATWFIAHSNRALDRLRWPSEAQLDRAHVGG